MTQQYDNNDELFLLLTMDNKPIGFIDSKKGNKFNYGFTTIEKLQSFINFMHDNGATDSKNFKAFPTTFGEYFGKLKPKLGDFDVAVDPPEELFALNLYNVN